MATPRIFVSSTFYDLRHVRGELERFIKDIGYDPVLNERGHITYGSEVSLEEYCYQEVDRVSMVVSIIGGRFGSQSQSSDHYSISNMELKTALKHGKQVYIFIENNVLGEYRTFLRNKGKDIDYHHVDDPRVYSFIEEIYKLPINNQIHGFDGINDIIGYLKLQWAGLFEKFLQQISQSQVYKIADTMQSTAETLKGLVELLRAENLSGTETTSNRDQALDALLMQNHPIFNRFRELLGVKYRVFFTNKEEMITWLKARSFEEVDADALDGPDEMEFIVTRRDAAFILYVPRDLFDDFGNLKTIFPSDWDGERIRYVRNRSISRSPKPKDDEIPF